MEYSMVIDGRSVTTGQWDDVINPAKGEPFAQCPRGTQANVEEAVTAAARAFKTWRTDEAVRRQKLNECAAAIQGRVQDIAAVMSLSPSTVGTHLYNIKQKLGAANSAELALIAMRAGLLTP